MNTSPSLDYRQRRETLLQEFPGAEFMDTDNQKISHILNDKAADLQYNERMTVFDRRRQADAV